MIAFFISNPLSQYYKTDRFAKILENVSVNPKLFELKQMSERLADRFGPVPEELARLFDIVRIRQLGQKLGFEKIIIKNNVMIAFFISNPLSQYYKSNVFSKILESVTVHPDLFELKQNDNRLRVFVRNVESLSKAYEILKKL